eukprot:NODE_1_length_95616_cov_0.657642.p18 type:complete len:383 gc:universal NODE_1_length_95616_cov_0.657642:64281-65429(+)
MSISFKASYKTTAITQAFAKRNWTEKNVDDSDFTLFWSDVSWIYKFMDSLPLQKHQLINHFRNNYELTKKDLLIKNLKMYWRKSNPFALFYDAVDNIVPVSFEIPTEFAIFHDYYKKNPKKMWIMKPSGKSQGKGIFMVTKLALVRAQYDQCRKVLGMSFAERENLESSEVESYVVQEYIINPLLIGFRKFDMRLYVLVTSFCPLIVYIHKLGFCRFSQSLYSLDYSNLAVHATNVAIQKNHCDYNKKYGCKWNLNKFRSYLAAKKGYDACVELFNNIEKVILTSLFSVENRIIHSNQAFELYGYDVLIDENLKPWLIEVNASPSLTSENDEDLSIKVKVLSDMLDLLHLDKKVEFVNGFQPVYNNGFIAADETYYSKIGTK